MTEDSQHRLRVGTEAAFADQLSAGRLEPLSVPDTGRTDRLAAAAAEAGIEVLNQGGVIGADLAPFECAHQHDAAPRAVGLVTGGEVGWAGGKAESAVNAGVERPVAHCRGGLSGHRALPRQR
jgi:hypothetical protein